MAYFCAIQGFVFFPGFCLPSPQWGLKAALSAVTAAVVGVIFNLTVWFGVHVLFPLTGEMDGFGLVVGITAMVAMQWGKLDMTVVILSGEIVGQGWKSLLSNRVWMQT